VDVLNVNLISIPEFIKNKEASGRKNDLGDIDSLKKNRK
jgi:hypothetical protein